jgi:hypothetical protein
VSYVELEYEMSERHACRAAGVDQIKASLSGTQSHAGCATANAAERVGEPVIALRLCA